jgi:hypothetical protein
MAQPTVESLHIDSALSNIAIGYKNGGYIADQIFPTVGVDKQSDYYFVWTKKFWFTNHVQFRGPGAAFAEGGLEVSKSQYSCKNKALAYPIAREQIANQDAAIDLEKTGAEWLADQFALDREINCAATVFNTSNWTSTSTLTGTNQWSDYENSDPLGNAVTAIQTVQKLTGLKPNLCVMGATVFDKVRRHPDILDIYKYREKNIVNEQQIADAFDVERVIVGRAIKDTGNEGAAMSGDYIWGDYCLFVYVPKSPGLRVASGGYTFVWKRDSGLTVEIDRFDDGAKKRYLIRGEHSYDQKITGADCGYIYADLLA